MTPGRADQAIEELYPDVMHEVIQASLVDFEDAGISLRILDELKSLWQQHLTEAGIGHFPWDSPSSSTRPIKIEPIDFPLLTPFSLVRSYGNSSTPTIPYEPIPWQRYAAARMSNPPQGPSEQRFPQSGNETKNASPKTPQNRTLNGIPAGFTSSERPYGGLGFKAYNVEIARQRAQQLVQERQQRQQQQISPAVQTTFLGIASVLGTHPGSQQRLQGGDGPDMKSNGQDSQGTYELFNPGTSPTPGTPTSIQPPQPTIVSTPKEGQSSYTRQPTTYSRSVYCSSSSYPYSNVSLQQKPPSNPPQLDGPSGSPELDTSSLIADPTVTITQPEAGKGISDKELTDADDTPCGDGDDEFEDVPELMVCLYDKVARSRSKFAHKWRCALRDGVLVLDGREYVFVKATAELTW